MKKIRILGAGISGLTAATTLAKAGYEVEVYEKKRDVGMRFHGDLEGLENWSEKKDVVQEMREMGLRINFDCDEFHRVKLTNLEKSSEIQTERPLYYLVKRGSYPGTLDYGLREQAEEASVKIRYEETLPVQEADIAATGPIPKNTFGIVKGIAFTAAEADTIEVIINNEAAHRGYSYLLITKGYGCIGTVVVKDLSKITRCFEITRDYFREKYDLAMESAREFGGAGSFSFHKIYRREKTLYTGEAAGLQDFLYGFGMRYALRSGYLAAKCIIEGRDYEQEAIKCFEKKTKACVVNRYLWEKTSKYNYKHVIDNFQFIINNRYHIYNYCLPQKILYPFALKYIRRNYPSL
jgi:flavin-dependent dehydrogenase